MNWNDAVKLAENDGCDACQNPEQCAAEGLCIALADTPAEEDE